MSISVADIQDMLDEAAIEAEPFLAFDSCTVSRVSLASDGFSGKTLGSPAAFITGRPCMVEEIGGAGETVVAGGITYISSHRIYVKDAADILTITPRDQLKVAARDNNPQMIFEQLIVKKESFSPLITIYCSLVVQGFRTPGTI